MEKQTFKTKKHLGQHFLNNTRILETMIAAANVSHTDTVLEVGPGMGVLTTLLAQKAKKVIAVEKDTDLLPILEEKFRNKKNVVIMQGDILRFTNYKLLTKNYKLIANIPYYITGQFLRLFLTENKLRPKMMVLMVQKEIAERIVARDKKESLLSLSVKAYGTPSIIRKVPKGSFVPPPKVDSAVIKLDSVSNAWFTKNHIREEKFFEILKKAFRQKRKMLRQSLKDSDIPLAYREKRPENLSLDDWAIICSSRRI